MITDLNKILVEWSYRTSDGQPDVNNSAKLLILESVLNDFGWSREARAELLNNLINEVKPTSFVGMTKAGKKRYFQDKDSLQRAIKRGSVTPVDKKDDKDKDAGKPKPSMDFDRFADKPKDGDDSEDETQSQKVPEETKVTKKYKDETNSFLNDSGVPEHKEVKKKLDKLYNGESLSEDEKEFLSKWIRVVEPTASKDAKYKIYIAREENRFTRKAKPRAEKIPKSPSTGKDAKELHSFLQKSGIRTQRTSTFGGKKTTANQTYVGEDGQTKLLGSDDKPVASVQRDGNNPPKSITIGEQLINRQNDKEDGISDEEAKARRRHNRNLDEYAKSIEGGTLDFIDMNEGVTPDSPENRVTVIKSAIGGMTSHMKKLASEPIAGQPAPPLSDEANEILDDLEKFANRNPNDNPQKWMKDFDTLMSRFSNEETLTEGWANYAEVYTAIRDMHNNGEGTENGACVLLPESTTLETVDTIVISEKGEGERKIVTLDGVSVKKGVGGASALTSKVAKSIFRAVGDLPKEDVKEKVLTISKAHDAIYGMKLDDEDLQSHLDYQNQYRMDLGNLARDVGISDEELEQIEKDSEGAKVENALKLIMRERKIAGLSSDSDAEEKMRQRLRSYYVYQMISHAAYNNNVDVQDFSNESVTSQTKTLEKNREIKIDSSNGIDVLAYPAPEYNVGFSLNGKSRNPGAGRFKNKPKKK